MSDQAIPPAETDGTTALMPDENGQERYRLSLLGPFKLIDPAGREIAIASKKNRLLLAMLTCAPGKCLGREVLATVLWSEHGDEQAKSSLRQAMAVLRKELGEPGYNILTSLDSKVLLNREALTVDIDEFTHTAGSPDAAGLRIAVSLWKGEFLQGTLAAEEALEAWLRERREQLRALYLRALDNLVPLAAVGERVELAQQLVRLDDLREASHRRLMEAYAANGERASAVRHYDKLRRFLSQEIGVEPAAETDDLRSRIAAGGNGRGSSQTNENALRSPPPLQLLPADETEAEAEPAVAAVTPAGPSVAVLPFANRSNDPAQDLFCDALSENIITELTRWRDLSVRSWSASFRYRDPDLDVKKLATELNIRYIVKGSVRRMGEWIRIAVQLIDSETGSHVWAEHFDRETGEIFKIQDEVVRQVVSTLVGRVHAADVECVRRKPPTSLVAYECVLKGNTMHWDDPIEFVEATRLFTKAINLAPNYGFAHAMLAVMHLREWENDQGSSDRRLNEAYRLAKLATELDSNDSTCFGILALACMFRRSFNLAMQYARRAVEINPGNQWAMGDMGVVVMYSGQPEAALRYFHRARAIDPYFDPPWCRFCMGQSHMMLHRYQEALAEFEHLPVRSYRAAAYMAGCYARLADKGRTVEFVHECLTLRPSFSIGAVLARRPFESSEDAAHISACLHQAGLPM